MSAAQCCGALISASSMRIGKSGLYGTRKGTLLESVRPGVTTWTLPVVAPTGTVVEIAAPVELTVKTAAVPLNVTLVARVRSVPKIVTAAPTFPEVVCVSTNGPSPTDRLKIVPQN
jgi:hypothetical protein